MSTHPRPVREVIASRVTRYRDRAGLTQQQLAQAMTGLGYDTHRRTISRIEKGERNVLLEELLVLAAVLDVPPILLFLPLGEDTWFSVGSTPLHTSYIRKWVIGEQPFGEPHEVSEEHPHGRGVIATGRGLWSTNSYPASAFAELSDLVVAARRAKSNLETSLVHAGVLPAGLPEEAPFGQVWALADAAPEALRDAVVAALRNIARQVTMMQDYADLKVDKHLFVDGWVEAMQVLDPRFRLNDGPAERGDR